MLARAQLVEEIRIALGRNSASSLQIGFQSGRSFSFSAPKYSNSTTSKPVVRIIGAVERIASNSSLPGSNGAYDRVSTSRPSSVRLAASV
jgi:hypothetical protein